MRVGIFGDIHGNLSALVSVWAALAERGLQTKPVLNAGDNVGYGDAPEECIRFLRAHENIVSVRGNYDKNVARFPDCQAEYKQKWGRARPEKYRALKRDSDTISDRSREWLRALPREATVTLGGHVVLVTHYAPGSKEGLGAWTSEERLIELAEQTSANVVVCGHTHSAFARAVAGVLFVNPGTVGRTLRLEASYGVLHLPEIGVPSAEIFRIPL